MKSSTRIALFTSAAALSASMLLPAAFAAQSATATVPAHKTQKKENTNITAARQSLQDARNPAHAGARAVEDLGKTWDSLRKAGFSPDLGEGFARIGITERQYQAMKMAQLQHTVDDAIRDSQLPENAGLPAVIKLKTAIDYSREMRRLNQATGWSYPSGGNDEVHLSQIIVTHYKEAARQELENAVLTRHDDPVHAAESLALMDAFLKYAPYMGKGQDLYTAIGSSKEIVRDIKDLVFTEAARKLYQDAIAPPHKGTASFEKMNAALRTLHLIAETKDADSLAAHFAPIDVTPEKFVEEWRLQGQAAANEILQKSTEPEFMGLTETRNNLQRLPEIVKLTDLSEPPAEEVLGRKINNLVAATNRELEEARKPENKGPKAITHLLAARSVLYAAGDIEPDPDLANAYHNIETIVSDYTQLYTDNKIAMMKHNLQRAREPVNAGATAVTFLSSLHSDLQDLSQYRPVSDSLSDIGLAEGRYEALVKQQGLIAATKALQSTRKAVHERKETAYNDFSGIDYYLNVAGYDIDHGIEHLHLTKSEYNTLRDQAKCLESLKCAKTMQHSPAPKP